MVFEPGYVGRGFALPAAAAISACPRLDLSSPLAAQPGSRRNAGPVTAALASLRAQPCLPLMAGQSR